MPTSSGSDRGPTPLDAVRAAKDWAPALPRHLRATWIILATYYPNIFPDAETLAELVGVSRASVVRYLHELGELGAVTTEKRYVRTAGATRARAHRTLIIPELGTAQTGMLPDWAIRAATECEAHQTSTTPGV